MKRGVFKLALLMAFLVWLIVGMATVWGRGGIHEIIKAKEKELKLKNELIDIKKENAELEKEIQILKTSPEAYEVYAREKLFMKKPNEVVIYLPQNDSKNGRK
jgi:cell division protein FtsB